MPEQDHRHQHQATAPVGLGRGGLSWDTDALSTPPSESWKTLAGITDGWGLKEGECNAVCESAQDNVVATVVHYENGDPRNIRSTDGGKTWAKLKFTLPCQWDGNVAVSRNDPNRFLIGQCTVRRALVWLPGDEHRQVPEADDRRRGVVHAMPADQGRSTCGAVQFTAAMR